MIAGAGQPPSANLLQRKAPSKRLSGLPRAWPSQMAHRDSFGTMRQPCFAAAVARWDRDEPSAPNPRRTRPPRYSPTVWVDTSLPVQVEFEVAVCCSSASSPSALHWAS